MKRVIIAEKPSVAKNISDALNIKSRRDGYFEGEDYIITWAFGHLLQLFDAKDYDDTMRSWRMDRFPFIPEEFKYKVKVDNKDRKSIDIGAQKQLNLIKSLIDREDVESIISATDFDREGQVIGDELFIYFNEKKPVYRMLLNEWTEDEVKKGLENLKLNKEMQTLQDAGIGRQWADWIIGINLTSVATLRYKPNDKKILNIGRVLLPTLKIIYDRDKEIENFKPSTYYKLLANFNTKDNVQFEGLYYENDNEKFDDKKILQEISESLKDKDAVVIEKQVEKRKDYAPLLFNLSNLQGHITSKFKGWTSDKVLKVAQSLYEKKFITYPRTGSVALEESLKEKTEKVLNLLKKDLPYEKEIKFSTNKRIFDNKKVEGHSAIVPTYMKPSKLTVDEKQVYEAVKDRFIMQFLPVAEYEETKLVCKVNEVSIKGIFVSKGKVQTVLGWRVVEKTQTKDTILPMISEGEVVDVVSSTINTVTKKPPKLHIEKTLLRIMETCGKNFKEDEEDTDEMMESILSGFSIGTPATRAETIKKLKDVGYIKAKGKSLTCTELGKTIVEIFPCKELLDLEYTGRLEKTLSDIEKDKFKKEDFLEIIKQFTIDAVNSIKNDLSMLNTFKVSLQEGEESIGICPACGNAVVETEKNFGCINWKNGCKFTIWKDDKYIASFGKTLSKEMVEILLKNGKVGFRNLRSKKGNLFSAYFKYVFDEKTGYYNWELEFI
ncbi:type IA DNA topoisomerase [Tissierella creatinophila]|uniref:DNA topoisomerase n=1 Tax=Tissierella creatinophila DSM 6911 TaxID=1123403 RepID=A0A1U7M334_TISCR|nr:type IA DNA topoisomerase [Tissierella creatinophila]OLS01660.1 DNA topoisomerase 3 [Tissierella creatinophila DSM 6911]